MNEFDHLPIQDRSLKLEPYLRHGLAEVDVDTLEGEANHYRQDAQLCPRGSAARAFEILGAVYCESLADRKRREDDSSDSI